MTLVVKIYKWLNNSLLAKNIKFSEGVVEIWLTSEDLGAYGKDIGVTLPQLLWKLVDVIPEGRMVRLGMTNPPYILEHLEVGVNVVVFNNEMIAVFLAWTIQFKFKNWLFCL